MDLDCWSKLKKRLVDSICQLFADLQKNSIAIPIFYLFYGKVNKKKKISKILDTMKDNWTFTV